MFWFWKKKVEEIEHSTKIIERYPDDSVLCEILGISKETGEVIKSIRVRFHSLSALIEKDKKRVEAIRKHQQNIKEANSISWKKRKLAKQKEKYKKGEQFIF